MMSAQILLQEKYSYSVSNNAPSNGAASLFIRNKLLLIHNKQELDCDVNISDIQTTVGLKLKREVIPDTENHPHKKTNYLLFQLFRPFIFFSFQLFTLKLVSVFNELFVLLSKQFKNFRAEESRS